MSLLATAPLQKNLAVSKRGDLIQIYLKRWKGIACVDSVYLNGQVQERCNYLITDGSSIDSRGRGLETGSREPILATFGLWTVRVASCWHLGSVNTAEKKGFMRRNKRYKQVI